VREKGFEVFEDPKPIVSVAGTTKVNKQKLAKTKKVPTPRANLSIANQTLDISFARRSFNGIAAHNSYAVVME